MAKRKLTSLDDEMGLALEKSFRSAVKISEKNGYVSFYDEPKNSGVKVGDLHGLFHKFSKSISDPSQGKNHPPKKA